MTDAGQGDVVAIQHELERWIEASETKDKIIEAVFTGGDIIERFRKRKDIDRKTLDFQMKV